MYPGPTIERVTARTSIMALIVFHVSPLAISAFFVRSHPSMAFETPHYSRSRHLECMG